MTRHTVWPTAIAVALIAVFLAGEDSAPAAERVARIDTGSYSGPNGSDLSVETISNDSNSHFVSIVLNKSIALDLPRDVNDVLIGNEKVASAVLRTKRRVYVIGTGLGQTNVYFYDAKGEQIEGLNVNVADHVVSERDPNKEIVIVRGATEDNKQIQIYECMPICALAENARPAPAVAPVFVLPNVTSVPHP